MSERIKLSPPLSKGRIAAFLLIGVGLVIMISSSDLVNHSMWNALWPLVLIGIGLDLVTEGRRRRRVIIGTLLAALVVAPIAGMSSLTETNRFEEAREVTGAVPLSDGIERLQVNIAGANGQLSIRDMSDSHDQVVDLSRDDVMSSFDERGGTGVLNIDASSLGDEDLSLRFQRGLPLDLTIDSGSAESVSLDLEELQVDRLNLNVGTGNARIKLPEEGVIDATIASELGGSVDLEIPDDLSARVEIAASISNVDIDERFRKDGAAYVSEDYDPEDEDRALIRISATVGNVKIH